uniref:Uncharacterized protein n=1 Tax=Arundo donax TaxID=35708 RepID=A0A0A8YT69_ARUDO
MCRTRRKRRPERENGNEWSGPGRTVE